MPLFHNFCPCGCFDSFKNQEVDFLQEYEKWFLILNHEQEFLGRTILILKAHKIDEVELTREEVLEKHEIYCKWHRAIKKAFNPDKFNQSQLGNEEHVHKGHLHWHFVPRYRSPIQFAGIDFFSDNDESQKLNYSLVQSRSITDIKIRKKIKDELLRYLQKS